MTPRRPARWPVAAGGWALLGAVLAGCATPPPPATIVSGRLSVSVAAQAGQPARGMNASFDLRGDGEAGELRLSTLLGPQIAAARWSPGRASLVTADGEKLYPDLTSLAQDALGEALPLQALPDWLAGRPWAGAPSRRSATGFEQLGWTLDLAAWAEGFVVARRNDEPVVTLRVRLEPSS